MEEARILIVEDEGLVARDLAQRLRNMGHTVVGIVASGRAAVEQTAELHPDLILMDIHLQGEMDGVDTASEIRFVYDVPVIYLTAYADDETLRRAKVTEPFGYILKPFEERELQVIIEMALYKHRVECQLKEYTLELDRLHAALERRVLECTVQLQTTISELADFSYSVAQDIRTHLRSLAGSPSLLLHGKSSLAPLAQRYQQGAENHEMQIDRLVDELLLFKRLDRIPLHKETVLPATLAREILADLKPEYEGRQVEVTVGDLPPCQASPTLLKYVFSHLLTNALKFTRSRSVTSIEIDAQKLEKQWVYYVKDNGVGFDMRHKSQLFRLFGRAPLIGEYAGNGIGLAIVQRIIHRHGGRIWAEGAVDHGATFYFTLPEEPEQSDRERGA